MTADAPPRADLVIRGGTVVDGSGGPRFAADVAVAGDRIVAVGGLDATVGETELDATGRIVAPGFVDVHTHDDRALMSDPAMAAKVSQGVTTVVVGNCGVSLAPARTPPPPFDLLGEAAAGAALRRRSGTRWCAFAVGKAQLGDTTTFHALNCLGLLVSFFHIAKNLIKVI